MADSLLVPIHVEALFVPPRNAPAQASRVSPPAPPQKNKPDKEKKDKKPNQGQEKKQSGADARPVHEQRLELLPGMHLHWYLPSALTQAQNGWCRVTTTALNVRQGPNPSAAVAGGLQLDMLVKRIDQNADGSWIKIYRPSDNLAGWCSAHYLEDATVFPAVPNRWLVVSQHRPGRKYWIIESDYLHPDGQGAGCIAYPLTTAEGSAIYRHMGRTLSLDDWLKSQSAPGNTYLPSLTAVGYGLPTFASYYPHCHSVFGFHDEEIQEGFSGGLRYSVIGWYSNPANDFLKVHFEKRDRKPADALREDFGWLLPRELSNADPRRMFCYGIVSREIQDFETEPKTIAVANSGVDALSAYLADTMTGGDEEQKALIEEQLEFLSIQPRLVHDPQDVEAKFMENQHERGFNAVYGGSQWTLQPDPPSAHASGQTHKKVKTQLPADLAPKLGELNRLQREYDRKIQQTQPLSTQARQEAKQQYQAVLDQKKIVNDDLDSHNHTEGAEKHSLKEIPAARYWQPKEPVVLIPGESEPAFLKEREGALECRLLEGIEDGKIIRKRTLESALEEADRLPVSDNQPPWFLFLEWEAESLPAEGDESKASYAGDFITRNFEWNRRKVGLKLKVTAQKKTPKQGLIYQGSSFLAPHAGELLKQRVEKYLTTPAPSTPDPSQPSTVDLSATYRQVLQRLQTEVFLSQALSGFNDLLLQKQSMPLTGPDPLGLATGKRPPPAGEFIPIRSGALKIQQLRLVDTFGRVRDVPVEKMIVSHRLQNPGESGEITLPPRLLQPARLNFRWLAAESIPQAKDKKNTIETAQEMNAHPATHPICGWLLPGFLDHSLMVYDASGSALGLVTPRVASLWLPAPDSKTTEVGQIANIHLRKIVEQFTGPGRNSGALESFLGKVETALENISPAGEETALAMLVGHPIAVVRASLELEMFGGLPKQRALGNVRIPIRLGAEEQLSDGLIGYWPEDKQGAISTGFLTPKDGIELALNDAPRILTMLLDPHGKVHATSGVLPVKTIDIPAGQYSDLLQHLAVTFLAAPILTGQNEMDLPVPHEPGQSWTWLDSRDGTWKPVNQPTQQALAAPQEIREVWLKVTPEENISNRNLQDKG
jgi:hypothetical protein